MAFLRFIVRAAGVPVELGDDGSDAFLRRPTNSDISRVRDQSQTVEPFDLPPPGEAEQLWRLYFTTVNMMVPCVHEDSFRTTYKRARNDGPRTVTRSWLAMLNMVFALATNVLTATSPPRERASRSDMYFERAMELVRQDILGRISVEHGMFSMIVISSNFFPWSPSLELTPKTVQVFLLMGIYLEGTTSSSLAWTFHSLTVKGAYQLGLHYLGSKNHSLLDREIRRRAWYCCIMNDR